MAWASRRDDGAPFTVSVKLTDLKLTSKNGYHVLVSVIPCVSLASLIQYIQQLFTEKQKNKIHAFTLYMLVFQDLYDETRTFDVATPKINFNVRINPSGELK